VDNLKNITNSQNSVRKKSFEGTFSFSNCHIIGSDTGSLVLIVFVQCKMHLKVSILIVTRRGDTLICCTMQFEMFLISETF
jgi:hypothetical protein